MTDSSQGGRGRGGRADGGRPSNRSSDRLSRGEINKDAIQSAAEATADTVGSVMSIVVGAVSDVVKAVGGLGTELFEIREASRRARSEHDHDDDST